MISFNNYYVALLTFFIGYDIKTTFINEKKLQQTKQLTCIIVGLDLEN